MAARKHLTVGDAKNNPRRWWFCVSLCYSTGWFRTYIISLWTQFLADDNFKCIFLNANDIIPIQISLKFVPRSHIDNKPALVQVMAWCLTGDTPLPELMVTQFTNALVCMCLCVWVWGWVGVEFTISVTSLAMGLIRGISLYVLTQIVVFICAKKIRINTFFLDFRFQDCRIPLIDSYFITTTHNVAARQTHLADILMHNLVVQP